MLLNLLRALFSGGELGGDYFLTAVIQLVALAFVLFCCLPLHEYAHAWMADKLGDKTARLAGRLTLNPFAHLDLWGSLLMVLVGIGYANPVPVNPRNMRCGSKKGLALTAVAGPVSNILLSFVLILVYNILSLFISYELSGLLGTFFGFAAYINTSLAVFNLLPLPPLDGFNILQVFLPYEALRFVSRYHSYIRWGLMALLLLGWLTAPIEFFGELIFNALDWLAGLPFRLL